MMLSGQLELAARGPGRRAFLMESDRMRVCPLVLPVEHPQMDVEMCQGAEALLLGIPLSKGLELGTYLLIEASESRPCWQRSPARFALQCASHDAVKRDLKPPLYAVEPVCLAQVVVQRAAAQKQVGAFADCSPGLPTAKAGKCCKDALSLAVQPAGEAFPAHRDAREVELAEVVSNGRQKPRMLIPEGRRADSLVHLELLEHAEKSGGIHVVSFRDGHDRMPSLDVGQGLRGAAREKTPARLAGVREVR